MPATESSIESNLTPTIRAWIVWILGCIFYFYEFLLQVSPSVMGSHLMKDFGVTADGLGLLSGVYFISYAGMQIPAGVLLDRLGPHRLLTLSSAVCAISSFIFGSTDYLFTAIIARFFIGLGSAFAFVGALKLVANWFPARRFALLTGLIITLGMLGAIGGEAPLAHLISWIGWRNSMYSLGCAGLIISLAIFLIVQDTPKGKAEPHKHSIKELGKELLQVLKNKQLWLVAVYGGLMYMPTPTLCGLWGVPFLTASYHLNETTAAEMISIILVGWAIGGPIWGGFSDRIARRLPPMVIGAVAAPLILLISTYFHFSNLFLLEVSLFAFGLFSSAFLPSFSIAREISKPEYCATGLGFMNMMNMIGVSIAQPLLGKVLDILWSGDMNNSIRVYAIGDYKIAITLMIIMMMVTLLLLPFIKDTYAKQST